MAVYYPFRITQFPSNSGKNTFLPVPEYDNWNLDRIDRDISRIVNCGLNGVLLAVEPSDLIDSHKLDMIKSFLVIASRNSGFKVAYLFAPAKRTQLSRSNVSSFLIKKGLLANDSIYKFSDNNVIFFSNNVELVSSGKPDFIYSIINVHIDNKSVDTLGTINYPALTFAYGGKERKYQISHVFAGLFLNDVDSKKPNWRISRKKGHDFQQNLEDCCKVSPNIVILSSWNDYSQGSSIENNSLDDTQMQYILNNFLSKYKK